MSNMLYEVLTMTGYNYTLQPRVELWTKLRRFRAVIRRTFLTRAICYHPPASPSVSPSVTQVDQSKRLKLG